MIFLLFLKQEYNVEAGNTKQSVLQFHDQSDS